MQFTIEHTIAAPRSEVYRAMTDIESWPERIEGITKVAPGEPGEPLVFERGASFKETRIMFGKEATETMTIDEVLPDRGYTVTAFSCDAAHRYDYTLEDTPDGKTRVTLIGEAKSQTLMSKVLGTVMSPLMKGTMLKCIRKDLESIERSLTKE